jgi:hypothetical protein
MPDVYAARGLNNSLSVAVAKRTVAADWDRRHAFVRTPFSPRRNRRVQAKSQRLSHVGPRGFAVFGMYHKKKAAPVPKGRKVSCDREGCNEHSRNSCRYRRCANSCQYALNPEQGLQERLSRLVRPNFYSAASF